MTPLDPLTLALRGPVLVEASAGTGKTHAIADLYVRLLLELGLAVGEILVVTYTNAATAELRARIRRRLHEALAAFHAGGAGDQFLHRLVRQRCAHGGPIVDRARLIVALHSFDEAAIFTIHGFCQRMLQDNAFESGAPFDTELIANQAPLVSEVVQDFWVRELYAAPEAFVRRLANERITPAGLEDLAIKVVTHPAMAVVPAADDPVLHPAGADAEHARALQLQVDLAAYARNELRRRKERARVQSFDDLLQRLAEALRGRRGADLAALIRRRFPAALVDEFQDTDPVQYDIFRTVYLGSDAVLVLVGDPKQAIYGFRGADVFAYLRAKRDVGGDARTLAVNRRSDPSLVRAVSALFGRLPEPFVFADIPFPPVSPAPEARDRLGGTAAGAAPLQILFVRRTGRESRGGYINKAWGEGELTRAVAAEIVRFLQSGATIEERRVQPGDVAVLCRKNKQAALMQEALRGLGVPSVLQGDASVFETPEAEEMERVLRALAGPGDARTVRAALATTILGQDAAALHRLGRDEPRWDEWVRQFQSWHEYWRQHGFVAAFRAVLDSHGVAARLLGVLDGERRLTNVLHLAELLHAAATAERYGPDMLVHWLSQMRTDAEARAALAGEAAQIRLESDAAAVHVTTVHRSKGLQYPVVYCPFLWDGALLNQRDEQALRFHDPDAAHRLTLDLGSSARAAHRVLAEREAFAENVRLLYVALTRARHRCDVVWGAFRGAESSALGYVLHAPTLASAQTGAAVTERIRSLLRSRDDTALRAELETLAAAAPGCIAVADLSLRPGDRYAPPTAQTAPLHCRAVPREPRRTWSVSSFSALASSGGTLSRLAEAGVDRDAVDEGGVGEPLLPAAAPLALADLPAGARTGQLLHEVLEAVDFQVADAETLRGTVGAARARFGFAAEWEAPLCRGVADVLAAPLGGTPPLRLCDVAMAQRLSELEFLFPVASAAGCGQPAVEGWPSLTAERLAAVFARHARPPVPADYAGHVRRLGFAPLAGYLRGFIDLAFTHAGRWYVVDYKSNRLGARARDYEPARLVPVMAAHHYFLQYHLYVVAVHRYLRARLPGYDYERDFGGVYYLFLRGMGPRLPPGNGVFAVRPPHALIAALSAALAGQEKAA